MKEEWPKKLSEFKGITDGIAVAKFGLKNGGSMTMFRYRLQQQKQRKPKVKNSMKTFEKQFRRQG